MGTMRYVSSEHLPSMIFCLNPSCRQPQNSDGVKTCGSCSTELVPLLRGRYRVLQLIGQGGFGRTYLAVDEDRLKAKCVIKQFSPQFQGAKSLDKAIQLFDQEAVRLHELGEHPQIPALLAYFEHDTRLYLVQQFIEGQNLFQELQRQGAFGEQKIRELLLDLLPILKFIHERQVIHRDITPGNIIRRSSDGKLVLIDFGVSKQLKGTALSQAGTRIGTEGYAPMEQMRSGRAFPASDLYSLGATSIHLLTQVQPDELYDPLQGRWLWRDHLQRRGIAISDRLAQILEKMLKDLVGERYQSVDEILRDLQLETAPVANPVTTPMVVSPPPPVVPARTPLPALPMRVVPVPPPSWTSSATRSVPQPVVASSQPSGPLSQPLAAVRTGTSVSKPVVSQPQDHAWKCIRTLIGHASWVTSVCVSPDRELLASGSLDDTICLWHVESGMLLRTLVGHTRSVNCLVISETGELLASGSDDDTVKIWNVQTGECVRTLTGHTRDVNAIAFSPDGQFLLSGSEDRSIRVWKFSTGELLRTLFGTAGMVKAVAISPDGKTLVSGGLDNKVKLWSLKTGELTQTCLGHANSITAIAISSDSKIIASGSKDKTIKLWRLSTGELLRTLAGHTDMINSIVISPANQTLISGSSDRTMKVWSLATGELIHSLTEHLDSVNTVAISRDAQILVSGSKDKTVRLWQ